MQGHVDCHSNFDEFLNVDQLIPTTEDQTTSLDIPESGFVVYEWEEEAEGEDIQLLPAVQFGKTLYGTVGIGHSN
jgi:hypothetical protein